MGEKKGYGTIFHKKNKGLKDIVYNCLQRQRLDRSSNARDLPLIMFSDVRLIFWAM